MRVIQKHNKDYKDFTKRIERIESTLTNLERKSTAQSITANEDTGIFTFGSGSSYKMGADIPMSTTSNSIHAHKDKDQTHMTSLALQSGPVSMSIDKKSYFNNDPVDKDSVKDRTPKTLKREDTAGLHEQYQRVPIFKSVLLETLAQREREQAANGIKNYNQTAVTSSGPQLKTLSDANM